MQLNFDFKGYKKQQAEWVIKQIGDKGNIISRARREGLGPRRRHVRGAGRGPEGSIPNVKVVATVYGQATASVAQSAVANVLPSLPHVDAVLGQGGDDFGVAQAFDQAGGAYAEKPPVIEGGGSSNFIKWWADKAKQNGYTTISLNTTPGIGGAAFWLTLDYVKGATLPKLLIMPVATVDQNNLKDYADLPPNIIVSPSYSEDWVKQNLLSQK